ncbi:MAG: acyltransferase family protein [Aestuariibacter sp.]
MLLVLLFHAGFEFASGGYVGVDVFFVISGFLITSMIVKNLQDNNFNCAEFYLRRFRRIFPALMMTCFISVLVAAYIFVPRDVARTAGAAMHSMVGMSNFYFWQESGYFDSAATMKPLLHTWSLSVEVQFYLLWPLLLLAVWWVGKTASLLVSIVLVSILSLAYSSELLGISYSSSGFNYDKDGAIFYLLPFRLFEFGLGALTAVLLNKIKLKETLQILVSLGGVLLIGYATLMFDKQTDFPSWRAIFPCLGAVLIIVSGDSNRLTKALVASYPFRQIGVISYSLYLVHWPLFVFCWYGLRIGESWYEKLLLIFLSLIGAVLLYSCIEKPFRRARNQSGEERKTFMISMIAMVTIALFGHAWATQGWSSGSLKNRERLTQQEWQSYTIDDQLVLPATAFHNYVWQRHLELERPFHNHSKFNVLVIGDSMAGDFTNILLESPLARDNIEVRTIAIRGGCKSIFGIKDVSKLPNGMDVEVCRSQYDKIKQTKSFQDADKIVLASSWKYWTLPFLKETIDYLESNREVAVAVVGIKAVKKHGLTVYAQSFDAENETQRLQQETLTINEALRTMVGPQNFLDLTQYYCTRNECPLTTPEGYVLYYDNIHVTPKGAAFIGEKVYSAGIRL